MKRNRIASLLMLTFCASALTWAIDAELKSGQSIKADRMTFDGQTVTLYKDAARHAVSAAEIKYLTADNADQKAAEEKNALLQQRVDKIMKEVEELEANLLKAEEDLVKERTRYGELLEKNRVLEKTLNDSDLSSLQRKISQMEEQNRSASQTITQLREELSTAQADLQKAQAANRPPAAGADLKLSTPRYENPETERLVKVLGQVTNTTASRLGAIVIEVTALDRAGAPLASRTTFVSNVEAGGQVAYTTDLEADYDQVGKLQVRVADLIPVQNN